MNARGMPDVDLSDATKERLADEKKADEPKPNLEIFVKPIDDENTSEDTVTADTKVSEEKIKEVTDEIKESVQSDKQKKIPKPKRKLTDKQLDALRRGREKSIETRRKNKEAKELKKAEKTIVEKAPEKLMPQGPQYAQQTQWQPPSIDYDKIITGLASRMEKQSAQRNEREHVVAENVNAFESKIREDERNKVINEIDTIQKKEDKERASIMAHKYLSKPKPVVDSNPYAYALQMGANSRYRRY
jgi:hypothetical protein|tara:strand:+ start:6848 stop:7582 length:735 start_codon:yes stop_codon:yes gene_type:complete